MRTTDIRIKTLQLKNLPIQTKHDWSKKSLVNEIGVKPIICLSRKIFRDVIKVEWWTSKWTIVVTYSFSYLNWQYEVVETEFYWNHKPHTDNYHMRTTSDYLLQESSRILVRSCNKWSSIVSRMREVPRENNRGWLCNIVDRLKLELCMIGPQLSGLEVESSWTGQAMSSNPSRQTSDKHCWVLYLDKSAVQYIQVFNGYLTQIGSWQQ